MSFDLLLSWCHIRTSHLPLPVAFGVGAAFQHLLLIQPLPVFSPSLPSTSLILHLSQYPASLGEQNSSEISNLYKMREVFLSPSQVVLLVGLDGGEEVLCYGGLFPLPCKCLSEALPYGEDGATQTRAPDVWFFLSYIIQDYAFPCEDNIIAKSNNIKFPFPVLFGKVPFLTINRVPAV